MQQYVWAQGLAALETAKDPKWLSVFLWPAQDRDGDPPGTARGPAAVGGEKVLTGNAV
jgi:hypothetical protein